MLNQLREKFQRKSSQVGDLIAWSQGGRPVWTPRQYDRLAEEGYQKNVIVFRCVNLIARNVATPPWVLYEEDQEVEAHPLANLMLHPNPLQTRTAFLEALAGHILLAGNAYVEAVGTEGRIEELYLLRPDRVQVIPGRSGLPEGYMYQVNGQKRIIPVNLETGFSPILHLKTFNPLNDWYGMSPLEAASSAIDQHNAVGGHNLALLQNGGRPSGALMLKEAETSKARLSEAQRRALRQNVKQFCEGIDNAGRLMFLEGSLEWKEMGLRPKDLDFVEGKYLSSREIAQAYGVPSMLVGVPGDSTFSNYKEAHFHLWEDTVLPLLNMIMEEMNHWLMGEESVKFSYDSDAIPALSIRREALWNRIENASFLTLNEKRYALGYSPIKGGDSL